MKINKELGELVFEGIHFNIYRKPITMADGIVRQYETVTCPDVIRVYPVNTSGEILLIREYNYTLDTDILRTVSGQIGENESPENAAQRELQEEIGLEADNLVCFATSRPIIKVDCKVYHFLARGLHAKQINVHEGELIEMAKFSLDDIPTLVDSKRIAEDVIALNITRLYQMVKNNQI